MAHPLPAVSGDRRLKYRLVVSIVSNFFLYAILLFVPAGTIFWARGWTLIAIVLTAFAGTGMWLYRNNKDLLAERLGAYVQKDQPWIDKVILITFLASYAGAHAFAAYDVFFLSLLPTPNPWVSTLGLVGVVVGCLMVFLTMRENTFAAPVVKLQEARQHQVVDSGIYQLVRHPMYAGMIPEGIGTALWLQSSVGALVMLVPILVLAIRITVEEKFLRARLEGYEAYTKRVRYRLIPYIW